MRTSKIAEVVYEIKRLMKKIDIMEQDARHVTLVNNLSYYATSRATGAVRRASMDLTRALADLRNYNR